MIPRHRTWDDRKPVTLTGYPSLADRCLDAQLRQAKARARRMARRREILRACGYAVLGAALIGVGLALAKGIELPEVLSECPAWVKTLVTALAVWVAAFVAAALSVLATMRRR